MMDDQPDLEAKATGASPSDDPGTAFAREASSPVKGSTSRPERDSSGGATSALAGWGALAVVVFVVGGGEFFAFDPNRSGELAFVCFALAPLFVVAVAALVRAWRDGEIGDMFRPEWGDATRGIVSAGCLVAGAFAFVHFVVPAGSSRDGWMARIYLQFGDPRWLRAHTGWVGGLVLASAAGEEIVWRGLVTRLIAERVGSRFAWIWAAIAYAAAFAPTVWVLRDPSAGVNPLLVFAALGSGLVWGGMARWTRRLAPCILSHAAFVYCVVMIFPLWSIGV
jgi:membrane protease YdiL (CAAX protease family)